MASFDLLGMISSECAIVTFWDIWLQKCRDLENWVRCLSNSLEMSRFDRAHYDFLL